MVYRTTLTPLTTLRREMDRMFDHTFGRGLIATGAWSPAVDIREGEQEWRFEVELPGVDPASVEVTADHGVLSIRGEKHVVRTEEKARWHSVERIAGRFERSFQLPGNVNEDGIAAQFTHGVLTVTVPKAEVPQPRRITVQAS